MADEQAEKPKTTRGLMATLPFHSQEEMREANSELGMAMGVIRDVVDAAVAGALPPGKVTELVLARRRKDDEVVLARRRGRALFSNEELVSVLKDSMEPREKPTLLGEMTESDLAFERGYQGDM